MGIARGLLGITSFFQNFTDFSDFLGRLSPQDLTPEDSKHSGSGRVELASDCTTFPTW